MIPLSAITNCLLVFNKYPAVSRVQRITIWIPILATIVLLTAIVMTTINLGNSFLGSNIVILAKATNVGLWLTIACAIVLPFLDELTPRA
jgi:hypothetical protein